jgi:hypothetical protein
MVLGHIQNAFEPEKTKSYAISLTTTFDREVPYDKLTYLGNIGEISRVKDERYGATMYLWENIDSKFTDTFTRMGVTVEKSIAKVH